MHRWVGIIAGLGLGLLPPVAHAARVKSKLPKLALLDFPPEKSFDDNTNRVLNEFYATDLRQQGFQVISSSDMAAALGLERQRQLLGCNESNCMTELGGALGVDYIARGTVAVIGNLTALSLSLQDSHGLEVNRVSVRFPGHDAATLLEKLDETVPRLIQPVRESGLFAPKEPAAAQAPSPAPKALPAPAPVTSVAQQPEPTVVPYALIGGGGAVAIGGGAVLGIGLRDLNAWSASANHLAGSNPLSPTALENAHHAANREITAGALLTGAGLAAIGVGTALVLHQGSEATHAAREPAHNPGAVALLLDF